MGRFGNNKREIIHKGVIYNSIAEASKLTGTPKSSISSSLRDKRSWYYVEHPFLEGEIFKTHPTLDDITISNFGRIMRKNRVITKGSLRADGYRYFHHFNTKKNYSVHRLVLESWRDEPLTRLVVDHINGIKDDNSLTNLQWCTQKENVNRAINK